MATSVLLNLLKYRLSMSKCWEIFPIDEKLTVFLSFLIFFFSKKQILSNCDLFRN